MTEIANVLIPDTLMSASLKRASEMDSPRTLIVNVSPLRRKINVAQDRKVTVEPFGVIWANEWWRSILKPGRLKTVNDTDKQSDDYAWAWYPVSWAEMGYDLSDEEMPSRPRTPISTAIARKDRDLIERWNRYVRDTRDLPVTRERLEKRFTRLNEQEWAPVYEPQGGPTVVSRICKAFILQWEHFGMVDYVTEYAACACNVDEDGKPMGRNEGKPFVDDPEALMEFAKKRITELNSRKESELGLGKKRPLFSRKGFTGHR